MEVSKAFQKILTKQGISFKLENKVVSADKSGPTIKVDIESVKNPTNKETVCELFLFYYFKFKMSF